MLDSRRAWKPAPHLRLLNEKLKQIAFGRSRRLMVFMPPRHGKSELISRYTPAWFISLYPDRRVLLASYEADFARQWGRKAREVVERWGPELFGIDTRPESSAADRWDIAGREGGMQTGGIGGPFTGKGAHLMVIDDPVKNAEEAASLIIQERNWDWWRSTARTRLEPGGAVVLLMTRWHEHDLAGRILEHEGDEWETITLPALADAHDPLGREPGEALWAERYPVEELERIRASVGTYWFTAMFQGRPTPREGGMFKRDSFVELEDHEVPQHKIATIRMWDLAATEKKTTSHDPDWTAGPKVSLTFSGLFVIEDMRRFRESPAKVEEFIHNVATQDGHGVRIGIEQEPGAAGKSLVLHYQLNVLKGYPVFPEIPSGDKVTRAQSFSAFAENRRVAIVKGEWNKALYDELESFPAGAHDDQCLVAGTLVETDVGPRPIESVRAGDRVLTRHGYRSVTWAGMTNPAAKIWRLEAAGRVLEGTENHPVFTRSGWVSLAKVSAAHDSLVLCLQGSKSSFTRAESSGGIQTRHGEVIESISRHTLSGRLLRSTFTGPFGKMPMGRFHRIISSTTRTAILSITIPPTWPASQRRVMQASMAIAGSTMTMPLILNGLDRLPPLGTGVRRARSGIASTLKMFGGKVFDLKSTAYVFSAVQRSEQGGRTPNIAPLRARGSFVPNIRRIRKFVPFVARPLWRLRKNKNIAHALVGTQREAWLRFKNSAASVERRLSQRSKRASFVLGRVTTVICEDRTAPVFNLKVEGPTEFFANGILVHNCDAISAAIRHLSTMQPQSQGTIVDTRLRGSR